MLEKDISRFWSKVARGGRARCWPWQGPIDRYGYGTFYNAGRLERAHRVAVRLDGREIPLGLVVDHICRVRSCVNPAHLRVVSRSQNTLENSNAPSAANKIKTMCIRGHDLSGNNVVIQKSGRRCRLCDNAWLRSYRAKKKAERHAEN